MSSKWTRVKELAQRGVEQARDAHAHARESREAGVAARAEHAETARRDRIASKTRADGVIKSQASGATWDGRVLRVRACHVMRPNSRKWHLHRAPVMIPVSRIASAQTFGVRVHVTVVDGREYRFYAPREMAESIMDTLADGA